MESRERLCTICGEHIDDTDEVFVWHGIYFLDICTSYECQQKFINELEGEEE